jgi:uncharacterized LabA/DUF88 family protein
VAAGPSQRGVSMSKKSKRKNQPNKIIARSILSFAPKASAHGNLADAKVHVFVDDQNLFYGITNNRYGPGFRIDFGRLLLQACRQTAGTTRNIGSAYIAGVVPDNDSFWEIATNQGFKVRRGYLGSNNRSKQDDAYLITDMVSTLFEQPGPSTIVLIAGDADYVPPLLKSAEKGWRNEIVFIDHGVSKNLELVAHEFREIIPYDIQLASSMTS